MPTDQPPSDSGEGYRHGSLPVWLLHDAQGSGHQPPSDPSLWHYTCRHRAALIGRRGVLTPNPQFALDGTPLVWLTDLAVPDMDGLGLTSTFLKCDRTEVRYRVVAGDVVSWHEWADAAHVDHTTRSELTFGRRPRHWFVSTGPVTVERAQ